MQYRKIEELTKLPNNPRTIKDESFQKLCKSIQDNKDYFEARPLILSNRTGELVIIAGNQRLYNTLPISNKTHLDNQKAVVLNESKIEQKKDSASIQDSISTKAHIKQAKISTKTHTTQQTLFDFNDD